MYAFWMNGHNEYGAGSSAVVGIDTGPTPDETIFDDDATIAGPARCDDTDVTNPTTSRWCAEIVAEEQVRGADAPDLSADY
jgi:hypothetical protein